MENKTALEGLLTYIKKYQEFNGGDIPSAEIIEAQIQMHIELDKEQRKVLVIEARVDKDISLAKNVLKWNEVQIAYSLSNFEEDAEQYYKQKHVSNE